MAENNELKIILTLVDEASAKLKSALGNTQEETKKTGTEAEKTKKSYENAFQSATKGVREFRKNLLLITIALAAIVQSVREYSKYNTEARQATDQFSKSVSVISAQFGKILLPIVNKVNVALGFYANLIQGKKGFAPEDGEVSRIIEAEQKIKNIGEDLKRNSDLFLAGKIDAEEYYSTLIEGENLSLDLRRQSMAQMQEMANLSAQATNSEFMNARRLNTEKIEFLKEYQENYEVAHRGMMAFTTMVAQNIRTNLSNALSSIVMGTMKARDAFKEFGQAMLKAIVDFMIQKVIAFALEKTLLAGQVASAVAAGAATAAAWAPAALVANIASFGGAAMAAAATFPIAATSLGAAMAAGRIINVSSEMSGGGQVLSTIGNVGIGGAQATGGDYMVNRPTLFLAGEAGPERATFTPLSGGGGSSFGDMYINIYGADMSSSIGIEATAEMLGFEIERKLRSVRSIA